MLNTINKGLSWLLLLYKYDKLMDAKMKYSKHTYEFSLMSHEHVTCLLHANATLIVKY